MLLQAVPPDTSTYMIAGYIFFILIMTVYLVSLFVRRRNLEQDLSTLESLEAESKAPGRSAAPAGKRVTRRASSAAPKAAKRKQVAKKVARKR